jgi:hypothetical protein
MLILLVVERESPACSLYILYFLRWKGIHHARPLFVLLFVERDTPCVHTSYGGKGYTLQVHTACGGKGYTLLVQIAGFGNGYTLTPILLPVVRDTPCTSIMLAVEMYTIYILHVHPAGVGESRKGISTISTHCTSKLQVVESDTPCISIVYRQFLMVLFLLMMLKNNK